MYKTILKHLIGRKYRESCCDACSVQFDTVATRLDKYQKMKFIENEEEHDFHRNSLM
jgi:hypothetical protein